MARIEYDDPEGRFALRELKAEDAAGLEFLDRVVFFPYLRHTKGPGRFLAEAIEAQLTQPRTHHVLAIVIPDLRRQLLGIVGAIAPQNQAHTIDVGYCLVPEFQRRGIARAALSSLIAKVLTPQITELTATVDPENAPSIRLLEACGFERYGPAQPSNYLGDPDNPAHYDGGILQSRPRIGYRVRANRFGAGQ